MTETKGQYGPISQHYLKEGWAAGTFVGSDEWLTVPSSRYESRLIFAAPKQAEARAAWLRERWHNPDEIVVRRVRRAGIGFRVLA